MGWAYFLKCNMGWAYLFNVGIDDDQIGWDGPLVPRTPLKKKRNSSFKPEHVELCFFLDKVSRKDPFNFPYFR